MLPGILTNRARALPGMWGFRFGVAAALVVLHLFAFTRAAHVRLGVGFNAAPGEAPYYSDPDSPELMAWPRQPHYWTRLVTSRWDSQHYIGFALRGLTACPPKGATGHQLMECGLAWMPTYGYIAGRISDVTGVPVDYMLLIMSIIATLTINFLWTSKTIVRQLGVGGAYAALLAFNLFASSFYLVTPYMEAATFACVLGGYICMSNKRWLAAALCIGATSALRTTAVGFALGFGCAALIAAWQARREGDKKWWKPIVWVPLSVWGQIATMTAFKITVGNASAYVDAQKSFAWPNQGLHLHQLVDVTWYLRSFTTQHMDGVILFGSAAIVALCAADLARRLPRPELTFLCVSSAFMILLPIAALNGYWGLNRYLLLCPLTFFCAGLLAKKYPLAYAAWLVISILFYWNIEMCSYVAHGQPSICPCLGHMEWAAPVTS